MRHQLVQEFQPLCHQLTSEKINPCQVAARSSETGDQTKHDRVSACDENNGDRRCRRLGHQKHFITSGGDHGDLAANQIGRQLRQPINLILGEAVCDCHVLALDIARLL